MSVSILLSACNNSPKADHEAGTTASGSASTEGTGVVAGEYVNLETGEEVYVIPDKESGRAIDSVSRQPIRFYVNTHTGDTLFRTGVVVNNQLVNSNGTWDFDPDKVELDGDEIKIKGEDSKLKIEDGDMKYKKGDDLKVKTEKDGDAKIKNGDSKIKIEEDGSVKRKQD